MCFQVLLHTCPQGLTISHSNSPKKNDLVAGLTEETVSEGAVFGLEGTFVDRIRVARPPTWLA